MFTIISHLALTLSCSISFYIYYGKYGAPKQVMNRKLAKIRLVIKTLTNEKCEEREETINLPDMNNFLAEENTAMLETALIR